MEEEEDDTIEGVSPYFMQSDPLFAVVDDSTTNLPIKALNVEFTCPVCLGILRNTMTVMECLHRFCSECINKSLRLG